MCVQQDLNAKKTARTPESRAFLAVLASSNCQSRDYSIRFWTNFEAFFTNQTHFKDFVHKYAHLLSLIVWTLMKYPCL